MRIEAYWIIAHTLNLIIQAAFEDVCIKPLLKKVKDIVEYFKRSSSTLAKLIAYLQQNDLPVMKLKQDVPHAGTQPWT